MKTQSKSDRARDLVNKAKDKADELLNPDDKQAPGDTINRQKDAINKVHSYPAFDSSLIFTEPESTEAAKLRVGERRTLNSELQSVAETTTNPVCPESTAKRISQAQRPVLSAE